MTAMIRTPRKRPPTPPGEMLAEEFLKPLHMTQKDLAKRIHVSLPRVNEIVRGKRSITPDTALRLSRLFKTSPEFWLHGQLVWDLYHTIHSRTSKQLDRIRPVA
ncbi:MAG TPA: HigA family addiction module antitoxin [bacterium]|nr:HigA family addiction module antitoxin [bacterium]